MPKEQCVIYQVQLLIVKGVADFEQPLPGGLTRVTPKHGWVALDTFFEQLIQDGISESNENGRNQTIATLRAKQKHKNDDDPDRREVRCSLDRAKTSFMHHQFNTLQQLLNDGINARIRMQTFESSETLMEAGPEDDDDDLAFVDEY